MRKEKKKRKKKLGRQAVKRYNSITSVEQKQIRIVAHAVTATVTQRKENTLGEFRKVSKKNTTPNSRFGI